MKREVWNFFYILLCNCLCSSLKQLAAMMPIFEVFPSRVDTLLATITPGRNLTTELTINFIDLVTHVLHLPPMDQDVRLLDNTFLRCASDSEAQLLTGWFGVC